jgi:hypothetical protein
MNMPVAKQNIQIMRTKLRLAALVLALFVIGFWFIRGQNKGFTKNTVTTFVTDPVTGIQGPVEQKKFIPGVDFLGVGLGLAALQFGSSFIVRKNS